jgi:hypothetical protein
MSLASLSPEMTIRNRLRGLGCSENEFTLFNPFVGRTRFFEAMRDSNKSFDPEDANKMLNLIGEMESLQQAAGVPVRWSEKEKIETALVLRRVQSIVLELYDDHRFDQRAQEATEAVKQ